MSFQDSTLAEQIAALVRAHRSLIPIKADKKPLIEQWKPYQSRRATKDEIGAWLRQTPPAWAQVCGAISGVITADFDGEHGAVTMRKFGIDPHRLTGSGSYHGDIQYPGFHVPTLNGKSKAELGKRWPGLDIRGDGGYAIVLGRNGEGPYKWLRDLEPDPPSALPDEVWQFLRGQESANPGIFTEPLTVRMSEPQGAEILEQAMIRQAQEMSRYEGRNNAGAHLAQQARDNGYSPERTEQLLRRYRNAAGLTNQKGKVEEYSDQEIKETVRSTFTRPPREPWTPREPAPPRPVLETMAPPPEAAAQAGGSGSFARTDFGNGELFAHLYADRLRYDHRLGRWLEWREHWWEEDGLEAVVQLAALAARQRYHRIAPALADEKERVKEAAWAIGSENRSRLEAAMNLSRSNPGLADRGVDWDVQPLLLGTLNGVLDLGTGELRAGRQSDRITKHLPVAFDPNAFCPTFDTFLERVQPEPHMRAYLQRRAGYALTGDTSEQDLVFHHGSGANGKSTFAGILMDTMGRDYAKQAAPGLLLRHQGERHPTELADLDGARLVVSTEVDDGHALAEELVKQLTGGDYLKARRMRQDFFEFQPTAKLMLLANHKPTVKGTDYAIWRRIKLIPWNITIPERERDTHLRAKLHAEMPGILNWMVQGCLDWQRNGMQEPPEVRAATEEYRKESDPLADFLNECCDFGDDYSVGASQLYVAYRSWAERYGYKLRDILNQRQFGLLMTDFEKRPTRTGIVYYGLRLKAEG